MLFNIPVKIPDKNTIYLNDTSSAWGKMIALYVHIRTWKAVQPA
jgi:hypothetical protein